MKATFYLRVAKSQRGFLFNATRRPSTQPLSSTSYGDPLPTRQIMVRLTLPDDLFTGLDATVDLAVPAMAWSVVADAGAVEDADLPVGSEVVS